MNKLIFKLFIILCFCQGLFFYLGVPNIGYKFIIVSFTFFSFVIVIAIGNKTKKVDKIINYYLLYLAIILISAAFNNSAIKDIISYALYSLPAIVVYVFIQKVNFSELQVYKLNKLVFNIMIFQIIASVIKIFIWGTSEAVVGTIHFSGGSLNTVVPLTGISMLLAFYLFHKRSRIYLFLMLGFMFMAWTGEKRGIYFYLIIVLAFSLFSYNFMVKKVKLSRIFLFVVLFIPLSFTTIYFGAKYAPTLNPENTMGGSFDIDHIINYAVEYTTQTDKNGYSDGRFSGLSSVFNTVIEGDLQSLFIGNGPGELLGKGDEDFNTFTKYNLGSMLGINGWSTALISLGFLGAIAVVLFYFAILKFAYQFVKRENNTYWKAIGFGVYIIVFVFFLDFFTYTRSFYHSIPLNVGLLYFYAVIHRRDRLMNMKKL